MSETIPCVHTKKVNPTRNNPEGIRRCSAIQNTTCGSSCPFYRTEQEEREQELYCIKRLQSVGYTGVFVAKLFGTISFEKGRITSPFDVRDPEPFGGRYANR